MYCSHIRCLSLLYVTNKNDYVIHPTIASFESKPHPNDKGSRRHVLRILQNALFFFFFFHRTWAKGCNLGCCDHLGSQLLPQTPRSHSQKDKFHLPKIQATIKMEISKTFQAQMKRQISSCVCTQGRLRYGQKRKIPFVFANYAMCFSKIFLN